MTASEPNRSPTVTADIVQELNDETRSCINLADGAQNAIVNERENRLAMQFSRAAAEIVRLRGEVEELGEEVERLQNDLSALANQKVYKGNSIAWIHDKAKKYGDALLDAWAAAKEIGCVCDGQTTLADAIRARAAILAPAMPNGVEYDRELIARMLTELSSMGSSIFLGDSISAQAELLIAADNRDAAGVDDPVDEQALYDGLNYACDIHPPNAACTPAAVPAGEAVAWWEVLREDDPTFPRVMRKEEAESLVRYVNVHPFATMRPLFPHKPPAPVQAAPQEGEWPDYVMLRDTKLHDDAGGLGQRIFTTAGAGYTKVKYVRADLAAHPSACELEAVRELADQLRGELLHISPLWEATMYEKGRLSEKQRCIEMLDAIAPPLEAALQHRGDSRGGEVDRD